MSLLFGGIVAAPCHAQQITVRDSVPSANQTSDAGQKVDPTQTLEALKYRGNFQLGLTLVVTIFGFACLLVVVWLFKPSVAADGDKVARVIIVVVVVSASLVLITGGYSNEQIAPAFGLFGTMIGYILGSGGRRANAPTDDQQDQDAAAGKDATRTTAGGKTVAAKVETGGKPADGVKQGE